ncbi:FG-GAP repeat protein, partial [Candidatus Sumerlaeota bacterium]|nr:FG-GAP repeat protein [Candidatus Sumerlaeota bacterium]
VFNAATGDLVATLHRSTPEVDDRFGIAVAVAGNLAVVGASFANFAGEINVGAAYVFDATTGAPISALNNPAPDTCDYFGGSVAIDGNLAVVGAIYDDPDAIDNAGTAYVFNATTGAQVAVLNNPTMAAGGFGSSVSISGTVAVVGALFDDPGGVLDAGSASIFNATTGALLTTLNNPVPAVKDYFGASVAVSGNLILVGAYGDDPGGVDAAGSAYIFGCPPYNNAAAIGNSMPSQMTTGQLLNVVITMRNNGTTTWTGANGYALSIIADPCGLMPGATIPLGPGEAVTPSTNHDFLTAIVAPGTPASCNVQARMAQNGIPFGATMSRTVMVAFPANDVTDWSVYE